MVFGASARWFVVVIEAKVRLQVAKKMLKKSPAFAAGWGRAGDGNRTRDIHLGKVTFYR